MPEGLTRRTWLASGGALVVSFAVPLAWSQNEGAKLPGSLAKQPMLDGWIRVNADNTIVVFTGKVELGQGIKTALIQVAAEELVVAPARIRLVTADTATTPDEGFTAGSHSMQDSGTAIRNACAQARAILLGLAAQKLAAPADALNFDDGTISVNGKSLKYGELVTGQELHVQAAPASSLREPTQFKVMGRPIPRVDIPPKVTGGPAYVQDVRLPGMVHARVLRPPSPGATLATLDAAAVQSHPGVLRIVRDGNFVAVIATREWQAVTALRVLGRAARWNESATLPERARLYEELMAMPSQDLIVLDRPAATGGGKTLTATYLRPFQIHGSIGPSCAIAQFKDGHYTVWTHSQGVFPLRKALAQLLGADEQSIRCVHVEGSGCYGHNAADDVAADAALLARAHPGVPVRVQWMREDEHMWEPYGPAMVTRVQGTLDADGTVAAWKYEVWSPGHDGRPGTAGNLLAGRHVAQPFAPKPPKPIPQPEGGGDRNAVPLYTFPGASVMFHFLGQGALRTSALRSLGAYMNVFSLESFMDEMARAAAADPVAFRLKHLNDPRAQEVIRLAADKFGWNSFQRRMGRGRGFAFARYKNLAAYAAMACEVEVLRDTGEVRLLRVVAAVDSGEVVNPDGIRNQVEGAIVQSASWTLSEEMAFDRTRILGRDWAAYPILRFPQVPHSVDVHIVARPGQPFLGTGEVGQGPTGAMIANGIADATGARLRQLPFSPARVRSAL